MFYSHCLLSRKGPLRAIWVAAYYFKKLKKAQVFETDIPSSVDKILQDEFEVLTYRVLAYLLLGIVRIYSKKVEYLHHDCNEVLIQIKDFVVQEKYKAQTENLRAPYFSITLPVSFELDAFDLGILEDANEHNVRSQEEITLKDVVGSGLGSGQYSLDKYYCEEFAASSYDTCPMDCNQNEDELSFHFMDIDKEARTSEDLCNLDEIIEKLQCDRSFQEESLHHEPFFGTKEVLSDPGKSYEKGYHTDQEHVEVPEVAQSENHMCGDANKEKHDDRFSQEECVNLCSEVELDPFRPTEPCGEDHSNEKEINGPNTAQLNNGMDPAQSENHMCGEANKEKHDNRFSQEVGVNLCSEVELEPLGPSEPCGDGHTNEEEKNGTNTAQLNCRMDPVMEADNHIGNLEFDAAMEKLQDNRLPQVDVEQHSELVRPFVNRGHPDDEQMRFPEASTSEKEEHKVIAEDHPLSVNADATPRSKLPDASGLTAPESMLIPTPANRERAQFSRKRKSIFDDMIVFPNKLLRQWINDPSDLVRKRKKGAHIVRAAWKMHWISNLVHSFSEPSVPCTSRLSSLHYRKKMKVRELIGTVKTPKKLEVPAPAKPLETLEISTPPPVGRSPEQREIAPQTPVLHSTSLRSFGRLEHSIDVEEEPIDVVVCEHPIGRQEKEPSGSIDLVGCLHAIQTEENEPPLSMCTKIGGEERKPPSVVVCAHSVGREEREPFVSAFVVGCSHAVQTEENEPPLSMCTKIGEEKEPPSMVECAHSIETEEKEPSMSKDPELNLNFMSEDVFSCDGDIQEQDGWSERTRLVAKFLWRSFLDKKKRGEEEKVNLMQLVRGKTKKESSRLFYEILVLKTKGLVDVEQDNAFGYILVSKAPQWDQTHRADAK